MTKYVVEPTIDELIAQNIEDRTERIAVVSAWLDSQAFPPDSADLERLADYILREELTDRHPDKITRAEYPFMSEWQLSLRRDREYGEHLADSFGTDGRNHAKPERRRRTAKESRFVDKVSRKRNRQRNAQYRRDTAPGPVLAVISEPFVQCRDIADRWRLFIAR